MEQDGFDVWLRNRFHIHNSDMPDIFSHIDPNLDSLPNGVDEMLRWLNPAEDLEMEDSEPTASPLTSVSAPAAAAGPTAPPQAPQQSVPAQQHHHHQQHHVSDWQLAYLQQTVQQPVEILQAQQYMQQQQMLLGASYPLQDAAGLPAVAGLLQFDPSTVGPFVGWQQESQVLAAVAAGNGAGEWGAVGAGMDASLQHAGSSGGSHPSSGSSKQQQESRGRVSKQTGGGRKPRKVTDAQRAAHKRFRIRRKEQVSSLVAEVESKQAQLQALEAEHEALTAKARALDQLVASAGDSMVLMQHMEALSLEPKQQQPQQQQQQQALQLPAAPASATPATSSAAATAAAAGGSPVKQEQGVVGHAAVPAAAAAAAAAAGAADVASTAAVGAPSSTKQNPSSSAALEQLLAAPAGHARADKSSNSAAAAPAGVAEAAAPAAAAAVGQLTSAGRELAAVGSLPCGSDSNGGCPGSPSGAAAASLERLETAVRAALGRPYLPPLQQQQQRQLQQPGAARAQQLQQLRNPARQALQLQGTLPALQQLTKSLVSEIMQLVLQVNKEQTVAAAAATAAGAAAAAAGGVGGSSGNSSGSMVGGVQVSAAAARLQHIRQQVLGEFRAFASTNRIDICLLYTLNLETGMLVRPPPGHWVPGAQLLMQRLDSQTLQDIVVAHKLYTDALRKVAQQRRMLLMQLHAALRESTSASNSRYQTDSLYPSKNFGLPRANAVQLLNMIDSNLRKEYVMEGVFQWSFSKLLPPLVASELVVTSYPFLADYHHITTELMQLLPPQPDLAAATQAVQQQLDQQPFEQQQKQQQQQQEVYPVPGMAAQGGFYLEQQPYGQLQQLQQQPYQQLHAQQQQQMQAQMQMQAYASHPMQQQLLQQQMQQQMQQGYGSGRQVSTGVLPSTQPLAMTFLSTPCG